MIFSSYQQKKSRTNHIQWHGNLGGLDVYNKECEAQFPFWLEKSSKSSLPTESHILLEPDVLYIYFVGVDGSVLLQQDLCKTLCSCLPVVSDLLYTWPWRLTW